MSKSDSPAITVMMDYTTPYAKFVDYTKRKEAVEVEKEQEIESRLVEGVSQKTAKQIEKEVPEQSLDYVGYINYMKRTYATKENKTEKTGIFTSQTLNADLTEAQELKEMLEKARSNKSILWRGVISFDNEFLAQNGLYYPKTKEVDQVGIKKSVQKSMPNVIKREKLSDSAFWWGNIHLNTDNVHVHIGISEVESARPTFFYAARNRKERKGKFEQKTLKGIKSQVYNALLDEKSRDQNLRKEQLLAVLREKLLNKISNQELSKLDELDRFYIEQALNHLPQGKRLRYGSNAKDFQISKFFINRYLESQLDKNEDFEQYKDTTSDLLEDKGQAYTKADNNDMQKFVDERINDLKERLGNRMLRYLKEIKPQDILENQNNINSFSELNQKAIKVIDPKATLIHSKKMWEKLGYQVDENKAQPIEVVVPVKNKQEQEELGSKFKTEKFFDVRFVKEESKNHKKLDLKLLTAMTKDNLNELVEISKKVSKSRPEDRNLKQELGIFKYALKLKVLQERERELNIVNKLLSDYQKPTKVDEQFLNYKKQQINELQTLVKLQQIPKSKLSQAQKTKKEELQVKHLDFIQIPIKQVDKKTYEVQTELLTKEKQLAKKVEDQSIFQVLKGQDKIKADYVEELDTKLDIIRNKYLINQNNRLIKQSDNDIEKQQYRKENGSYFKVLKQAYQKLSPKEDEVDLDFKQLSNKLEVKSNLNWNYVHDPKFRRLISQKSDHQREAKQIRIKGNFMPVSKNFAKGISLIAKDNQNDKIRLLRQKARDDREEEREKRI